MKSVKWCFLAGSVVVLLTAFVLCSSEALAQNNPTGDIRGKLTALASAKKKNLLDKKSSFFRKRHSPAKRLLKTSAGGAGSVGKNLICRVQEGCPFCEPLYNPTAEEEAAQSGSGAGGQGGGGGAQGLLQTAMQVYQIVNSIVGQFASGGGGGGSGGVQNGGLGGNRGNQQNQQVQVEARPVGDPYVCDKDGNCYSLTSDEASPFPKGTITCRKDGVDGLYYCRSTDSVRRASTQRRAARLKSRGGARLVRAQFAWENPDYFSSLSDETKLDAEIICEEEEEEEKEEEPIDPKVQEMLDRLESGDLRPYGEEVIKKNAEKGEFDYNTPYNYGEHDRALDQAVKHNGEAPLDGNFTQNQRQEFYNNIVQGVEDGTISPEQGATMVSDARWTENAIFDKGSFQDNRALQADWQPGDRYNPNEFVGDNHHAARNYEMVGELYQNLNQTLTSEQWAANITRAEAVDSLLYHTAIGGVNQGSNGSCWTCPAMSAAYADGPAAYAAVQHEIMSTGFYNGTDYRHVVSNLPTMDGQPANAPTPSYTVGKWWIAKEGGYATPNRGGNPRVANAVVKSELGVGVNYAKDYGGAAGFIQEANHGTISSAVVTNHNHAWSNSVHYTPDQALIFSDNSWGNNFEHYLPATVQNYNNLKMPGGIGATGGDGFGIFNGGGIFGPGGGTGGPVTAPAQVGKPNSQNGGGSQDELSKLTPEEREALKQRCLQIIANNPQGVPDICGAALSPENNTNTQTRDWRPQKKYVPRNNSRRF